MSLQMIEFVEVTGESKVIRASLLVEIFHSAKYTCPIDLLANNYN